MHCLVRDLVGIAFMLKEPSRFLKIHAAFYYMPYWALPLGMIFAIFLPKVSKKTAENPQNTKKDN